MQSPLRTSAITQFDTSNPTHEDITFYFPKIKRRLVPAIPKASSLVPDGSGHPRPGSTCDTKKGVLGIEIVNSTDHSNIYVAGTVQDVIHQVLVLRKYGFLKNKLKDFITILEDLTDTNSMFLISDSLLCAALKGNLHETTTILRVLSMWLTKISRYKNTMRSRLKLRLRDLVSMVSLSKSKPANPATAAGTSAGEAGQPRTNALAEEDGTAARAAVIAGILFANDHLSPTFIVSLINNQLRQLSVGLFKLICKVLTAVKDVQFHFIELPANRFDCEFLLNTSEYLSNYLTKLKKRKLADEPTLENLQNMLRIAFKGSDLKPNVTTNIVRVPSETEIGKTWLSKLRGILYPHKKLDQPQSENTDPVVQNNSDNPPSFPALDMDAIVNELPILLMHVRLSDFE